MLSLRDLTMTDSKGSNSSHPTRIAHINRSAAPGGKRATQPVAITSRKGLTVILLLASVLSISALARSLAYSTPSSGVNHALKINRTVEPSSEFAGHIVLAVRPIAVEILPMTVDERPACAVSGLLAPSLLLFTSRNPFRSPPALS